MFIYNQAYLPNIRTTAHSNYIISNKEKNDIYTKV